MTTIEVYASYSQEAQSTLELTAALILNKGAVCVAYFSHHSYTKFSPHFRKNSRAKAIE